MPNPYFQFKQFHIDQSGAAMKVGTDGVLLGAWAKMDGSERRILDIGTGTGLIALMAAQRCLSAGIDAVEIDETAACQAKENIKRSPWPHRIEVYPVPVQDFIREDTMPYDHILANPPFFVDSLKAPDDLRTAARHADTLTFEDLVSSVSSMLAPAGLFSVIYPVVEAGLFQEVAEKKGLFCTRKTRVRGAPGKPFKRILMEFSRQEKPEPDNELTIELTRHRYSPEYRELTKDFYLRF